MGRLMAVSLCLRGAEMAMDHVAGCIPVNVHLCYKCRSGSQARREGRIMSGLEE